MEIRYATPYVSNLTWILNDPISEQVPVQNKSGQNVSFRTVTNNPGITVEITPYLNDIPNQPKTYEFLKGSLNGDAMEDVLANAGLDVAAAWANALDSMANIFPILQDPVVGDEVYGPKLYMRLDAWKAILPWVGNKAVVATLGIYDTVTFDNVQAYIQLVFADGGTIRTIEAQKLRLSERIGRANSVLADPPTYPNWETLTLEEQQALIDSANQELPMLTSELARLNAQLVAPLADLFNMTSVQTSIGALLTGIFTVLKATDLEYVDTDPAAIMSKFALPDVS